MNHTYTKKEGDNVFDLIEIRRNCEIGVCLICEYYDLCRCYTHLNGFTTEDVDVYAIIQYAEGEI